MHVLIVYLFALLGDFAQGTKGSHHLRTTSFAKTLCSIQTVMLLETLLKMHLIRFLVQPTIQTTSDYGSLPSLPLVSLYLNGNTIEQSKGHTLFQRFFALVKLADSPFIAGAGPAQFIEH
jgi:hypothetical protein